MASTFSIRLSFTNSLLTKVYSLSVTCLDIFPSLAPSQLAFLDITVLRKEHVCILIPRLRSNMFIGASNNPPDPPQNPSDPDHSILRFGAALEVLQTLQTTIPKAVQIAKNCPI